MPLESLSSLKSVVSYVGSATIAVRVIPSPPFGYLGVLGISPFGGRVTLPSTSYEHHSILFSKAISILSPNHMAQLVGDLIALDPVFVEEILINLDASLLKVWVFAELQIGPAG